MLAMGGGPGVARWSNAAAFREVRGTARAGMDG